MRRSENVHRRKAHTLRQKIAMQNEDRVFTERSRPQSTPHSVPSTPLLMTLGGLLMFRMNIALALSLLFLHHHGRR
jgi:hypothetical protein